MVDIVTVLDLVETGSWYWSSPGSKSPGNLPPLQSIKLISKQSKKNYEIIITGGYSNLFKNSINLKSLVKKDLTIQGLVNVIKYIK